MKPLDDLAYGRGSRYARIDMSRPRAKGLLHGVTVAVWVVLGVLMGCDSSGPASPGGPGPVGTAALAWSVEDISGEVLTESVRFGTIDQGNLEVVGEAITLRERIVHLAFDPEAERLAAAGFEPGGDFANAFISASPKTFEVAEHLPLSDLQITAEGAPNALEVLADRFVLGPGFDVLFPNATVVNSGEVERGAALVDVEAGAVTAFFGPWRDAAVRVSPVPGSDGRVDRYAVAVNLNLGEGESSLLVYGAADFGLLDSIPFRLLNPDGSAQGEFVEIIPGPAGHLYAVTSTGALVLVSLEARSITASASLPLRLCGSCLHRDPDSGEVFVAYSGSRDLPPEGRVDVFSADLTGRRRLELSNYLLPSTPGGPGEHPPYINAITTIQGGVLVVASGVQAGPLWAPQAGHVLIVDPETGSVLSQMAEPSGRPVFRVAALR